MIKVIEQGSYMNRVDKLPDGLYSAECSYLGTHYERSVDFISMRAGWRQ